jgi:hypothetical protein
MSGFRLRRARRVAFAMLVAGSCAACTHLETRPSNVAPSVEPGASASQGAQRGLSYALPMLQYELKFTYRLTKCGDAQGNPEFSITAEAANRYVAGERFEVDYEALTSFMKTTSFGATFHEAGTLRTINASARDRTGPVLADLARIGVSIASIAAGAPIVPGAASGAGPQGGAERRPGLVCGAGAQDHLAARKRASDRIGELTPLVERLTGDLTRLATLATAQAALPEDRQRYRDVVNALLQAQQELAGAQAAVAAADRELSVSLTRSWPSEAGDIQATADTIELEAEHLAKLAALFVVPTAGGDVAAPGRKVECIGAGGEMSVEECLNILTRLNVVLEPVTVQQLHVVAAGSAEDDDVIDANDRRWARGIFVREPTQARLVICRTFNQPPVATRPDTPARPPSCSTDTIYRGELLTAPQLGRLRLLPFTNGPFEEGELKLALRADGMIESFSYGEESAAAGAASNLATVAERIDAGLERIETERRSDIQYARDTRTYERSEAAAVRTEAAAVRADELAQLTHERDLLVRRREVILAQAGLTAAQIEALTMPINAELAQLNARIAVLRSTNDLTALQALQGGQ